MQKLIIIVTLIAMYHHGSLDAQHKTQTTKPMTNSLKQFSLLVRVPVTYTTENAKEAASQWDALLERWKQDDVYLLSFAFPGKSHVLEGHNAKVSNEPVLSGNLRVVSNIVLLAENVESALELARGCPILKYGGSVEVREIPSGVTFPASK